MSATKLKDAPRREPGRQVEAKQPDERRLTFGLKNCPATFEEIVEAYRREIEQGEAHQRALAEMLRNTRR
jgi:hypothetical protein